MYSVYRMFVMRVHIKSFVGALKEMQKLVNPSRTAIGFSDVKPYWHVSGVGDYCSYKNDGAMESFTAINISPRKLIKLLDRYAKDGDAFMSACVQESHVTLSVPCGVTYRIPIETDAVGLMNVDATGWDSVQLTDDTIVKVRRASKFAGSTYRFAALNNVYINGSNGAIVGTNEHVMYVSEFDELLDLYIPSTVAANLEYGNVFVSNDQMKAVYESEYGWVEWGNNCPSYPNYKRVLDNLPKENLTTWRINSREWLSAAKTVQFVAKGNANRVLIDQMSDDVQLSAKTDELFVSVKIPCPSDGFMSTTGVNVKYLIDAITTLKDPEFTGFIPRRPLRFSSGNEMVIVMPMAVS